MKRITKTAAHKIDDLLAQFSSKEMVYVFTLIQDDSDPGNNLSSRGLALLQYVHEKHGMDLVESIKSLGETMDSVAYKDNRAIFQLTNPYYIALCNVRL